MNYILWTIVFISIFAIPGVIAYITCDDDMTLEELMKEPFDDEDEE